MKSERQEAIAKISKFFSRKKFSSEEVRKIKRLAMKHNLKLSGLRKFYCKNCLSQLKGNIKIDKTKKGVYRTVICKKCERKNKFKIE